MKISDFAMFRPAYSTDYFNVTENATELSSSNAMGGNTASQSSQAENIPLRWIPWEVYIMVSERLSCL